MMFQQTFRPGTARMRNAALSCLLSTAAVLLVAPQPVLAEAPGVEALLKQVKYWRSKGREDLAQQALRRARAIDPNSAAVAAASRSAPAPKPAAAAPKPAPTPSPTPAAAVARPRPTPTPSPAPAAVSAATRAGQARVAGFDALNSGKLAAAEAQFERALGVNSRDADALGGLGLVRLRQERFTEAADLLGRASSYGNAAQWADGLKAARFFSGIAQARDQLKAGNVAQAQSLAEELVRSGYSEPAPALELLAEVYDRQGRYADAADLYRQASEGEGADEQRLKMRAARGRALAAGAAGDELGAIREFQSGLVIAPQDPWIRYEFANYMIERGRVPEAESLLQSLIGIGSADSLYAAALINNDMGRQAQAERLLDMIPAAQRTPQIRALSISVKTDAAIDRAKALAATGQSAQALNALHQLAGTSGIPVSKQAAIANAMFELGDTAGAQSLAQQALNGEVTAIEDYEGLIGVLVRLGRDDLAQMGLQKASRLAGASAEGQRTYARLSASLMVGRADRARLSGRFAESFDILQGAYNSAPDNTDILTALARLYDSGNMSARAAQTWQLVLARKPGDKEALLGLAMSAQTAGDRGLSEQAQAQVLRAFPQDYRVYMSLAEVEKARGDDRAAVRYLKEARELYQRQHGASAVIPGGNPFAGMTTAGGANPFRDQPGAAPAPINPFALGSGSRLPSAPSGVAAPYAPAGYGAASSYGGGSAYSAAPAPVMPMGGGAAGYGGGSYGSAAPAPYPGSTGGMAMSGDAMSAPQAYGGDPVMAQLQNEITQLSQDSGPRLDVRTGYRQRSGEVGLSQLDEIKGSAQFSTGLMGGRVYAGAEATVIDAGRPSGSGLARFGRNGTPEAQAIVDQVESPLVNADSQNASGVALSAGYQDDTVQLEGGTTPIGMGKTKFTFRAAVTPKLTENVRVGAWAERKPVTDSVVSYAGTRDPVTGERWGQVMRTGGGLNFSYDRDGSGVYGEGRYYRFSGANVVKNDGFEVNVGGYMRALRRRNSSLTVGLNVNYQAYDKSQNAFTFGNGGYFSPQSFISVGIPINYQFEDPMWEARASFTPGFQSYSQDASPLYPTDPVAQAELDNLKALNDDVRSYYDDISRTGFALSADAALYYKIGPSTRVGGEASYNTFGNYDEFRSILVVRQSFGSSN